VTRALVVHPGPEFSVADVYRGWVRGLTTCGVQVREYNLNDRLTFYTGAYVKSPEGEYVKAFPTEAAMEVAAQHLRSACYDWWPDIVVVVSAFWIPPFVLEVMRARRHRLVAIYTESPYEDDRQIGLAHLFDHVVLNDPTNIDLYSPITDTVYIPHAHDPTVHYPGTNDRDLDCSFVGTGYPSRVQWLEQVDWDGIGLTLAGNWKDCGPTLEPHVIHGLDECLDNDQTAEIYRRSKTSFNLYRTEANRPDLQDGWAMGPREVEMAACGLWFARQSRPESDRVFPMLPVVDNPSELGDVLRWAANNPTLRDRAAEEARRAVADRTFERHAQSLLQRLDI